MGRFSKYLPDTTSHIEQLPPRLESTLRYRILYSLGAFSNYRPYRSISELCDYVYTSNNTSNKTRIRREIDRINKDLHHLDQYGIRGNLILTHDYGRYLSYYMGQSVPVLDAISEGY